MSTGALIGIIIGATLCGFALFAAMAIAIKESLEDSGYVKHKKSRRPEEDLSEDKAILISADLHNDLEEAVDRAVRKQNSPAKKDETFIDEKTFEMY